MGSLQDRVIRWSAMMGKFFSIQVLVQILGLGCGILIVREMDKQNYAYFTIMTGMQGALNTLTDVGICGAMMSIGGRAWRDKQHLGSLVRTGLDLRFVLGVGVLVLLAPVLFWLLISNGCELPLALGLTAMAAVTLFLQARIGILLVIPRLLSKLNIIQKLELLTVVVRLALIAAAIGLSYLNTAMAVGAAICALAVHAWTLGLNTRPFLDPHAPSSPGMRKELKETIFHAAPNAIFSCVQGQLMIWIISIFGDTAAVADLGALGRPAAVLGIVTSFCGNILFPRFARAQDARGMLRNYLLVVGVYLATSGVMIGAAGVFPQYILWILGDQYQHLRDELLLMMTVSMLGYGNSMLYGLNLTKAWVQNTWLNVPLTILVIAASIPFLNLSTVHGVLLMSLFGLCPMFLINVVIAVKKLQAARKPSGE